MTDPRTKWFGEPWPRIDYRAPICDDDRLRVPTPVGEPCRCCKEPIVEGDQGTVIPGYVDLDNEGEPKYIAKMLPAHTECTLREVLGCYGNLTGGAHTHDDNLHEDARKVRTWVEAQR